MFSPLKSTCSKCFPQHQTSNIVSSLGPCHPFPSQVSGMASGSSELPQPTWRMAASSLPVVASVVKKGSSSESIWVSAIFWVPQKIIVIVFPIETYSNLIASLFVASQIPVLVRVNGKHPFCIANPLHIPGIPTVDVWDSHPPSMAIPKVQP